MKHTIITILLAFAILAGQAQSLPFPQLKDSAVHYYRLFFSASRQPETTKEDMATIINAYAYYRSTCLLHFKREKDKQAFMKWMVAQKEEPKP